MQGYMNNIMRNDVVIMFTIVMVIIILLVTHPLR